ncbi:predicted protein [Histoplasma capsulatum G186AR]|uniref:Uncharacterized protein n=1 Tax=Ajellomyces capsulatus (strain G186AR / H82 / ATCC MYA-2454 / RMSCC 2432) TaxID=447093 RepID=C0NCM0_AJECG|nr:uncharacterized protein HCBG_00866 [Histoplasma capsulatum G186AR]EEH11411.1 predicted protein [Histoplasma capsulatum G186AR]
MGGEITMKAIGGQAVVVVVAMRTAVHTGRCGEWGGTGRGQRMDEHRATSMTTRAVDRRRTGKDAGREQRRRDRKSSVKEGRVSEAGAAAAAAAVGGGECNVDSSCGGSWGWFDLAELGVGAKKKKKKKGCGEMMTGKD